MMTLLLIFGIAFVLSCLPALVLFLRMRRRFSRKRIVICPETDETAMIRLDAARAAGTGLTGDPEFKVKDCTRWDGPVGHCEEGCVCEIGSTPLGRAESA